MGLSEHRVNVSFRGMRRGDVVEIDPEHEGWQPFISKGWLTSIDDGAVPADPEADPFAGDTGQAQALSPDYDSPVFAEHALRHELRDALRHHDLPTGGSDEAMRRRLLTFLADRDRTGGEQRGDE